MLKDTVIVSNVAAMGHLNDLHGNSVRGHTLNVRRRVFYGFYNIAYGFSLENQRSECLIKVFDGLLHIVKQNGTKKTLRKVSMYSVKVIFMEIIKQA